jgi:hypothetical protein
LGDSKGVKEELLDQSQVRLLVKSAVEGEDGSRALEAVTGEVEFLHCMHCSLLATDKIVNLHLSLTVLKVELDGRSVGNLAKPDIEILAFPCLKKQNVVAVVKLSQLVQFVKLGLGVELCILSAVREH